MSALTSLDLHMQHLLSGIYPWSEINDIVGDVTFGIGRLQQLAVLHMATVPSLCSVQLALQLPTTLKALVLRLDEGRHELQMGQLACLRYFKLCGEGETTVSSQSVLPSHLAEW